MESKIIRKTFLEFFKNKNHTIVPSAPMVIKNDPTLMFTNAGMNQFKDNFLGNTAIVHPRIADTQKCLRVSGKHNDLEEVGLDTYHHTMFEMLGNWSFGDYFKKEAIEWAWELLTGVYKINPDNLYVTVFGGDEHENLASDAESYGYWKAHVREEKILYGSKKDNFWEMGDTGPCGPCSEIHIDLRTEAEKSEIPGKELVNTGHSKVIEIWNLVFIEFNRKNDGKLEPLPNKHVDTGMGFERLTMVLQNKTSNYETDIFTPLIDHLGKISGRKYGESEETDIAMRVISDHLRAVAFAIADNQLPSNNKAGYVIRRILRRAIRYGFTFLDQSDPFINELVPVLAGNMGEFFPELKNQQELIRKVIAEEESAFLRTLAHGMRLFEKYTQANQASKLIDAGFAFELYDTYGFPLDLTQLIAREKGWAVDIEGFTEKLEEQKNRSRSASAREMEDWVELIPDVQEHRFVGYDTLTTAVRITKYRKIKEKNKQYFQLVFNETPFYAESGGQIGDRGFLAGKGEMINIMDTRKENDLVIHIADKLPSAFDQDFTAIVDEHKRKLTACNHSATHLLQAALKKVLGQHIEQKGSLVDENHLRFDFSHYQKMSKEEIQQVEAIVNEKIRLNIQRGEQRSVPVKAALEMGATAIFGEKYGENVRVISFDPEFSIELCGGTHVQNTAEIGSIRIISETAIAAGIRRIEAITSEKAEDFVKAQLLILEEIREIMKSPKDLAKAIRLLLDDNHELQKKIEKLNEDRVMALKDHLSAQVEQLNGISYVAYKGNLSADMSRDLVFKLNQLHKNLFAIIASESDGKAFLTLMISEDLVASKGLNAGNIIRELAREIRGGGGGQAHFATAGGKDSTGLDKAIARAREMVLA